MCAPLVALAPVIGAASAGASAIAGVASARKQARMGRQAQAQAERDARLAREQQQRAFNAERANQPDVAGMLKRARDQIQGGLAGTMLTGPRGINPVALKGVLGSSSLLGGGG